MPTDTVYGLAIDPLCRQALRSLFALKTRPPGKAIVILVSDAAQAAEVVDIGPLARSLMATHWPGGLTIVCRRRRDVPVHLGDLATETVAVRAPDHRVAQAVLGRCGPLGVTSANRTGDPPTQSATEAQRLFGDGVAMYLDGGSAAGRPSTVVDATTDEAVVLRHGAVTLGAQ